MQERSFFILKIDTKSPIELSEFIGELSGIGSQFDKYIKANYPDLDGDSKFYVQEIRHGSYIVEFLPVLYPLIEHIQHVNIIDDFLTKWAGRVTKYFQKDGRDDSAGKSDLKDVLDTVAAIASDPNATHQIDFVAHEDGKKETRTILKFSTKEAKTAVREINEHIKELETPQDDIKERVTMVFERPSSADAKIGKRSGERVVIESISPDSKPLIYASELAERQIKHEFLTSAENPFKTAFIIDVNIELRNGRPWAYRVTNLHQIIPIEDEE